MLLAIRQASSSSYLVDSQSKFCLIAPEPSWLPVFTVVLSSFHSIIFVPAKSKPAFFPFSFLVLSFSSFFVVLPRDSCQRTHRVTHPIRF